MLVRFTYQSMDSANLGGLNPLPKFRAPQPHNPSRVHDNVRPEETEGHGQNCGERILPYLVQDRYDRDIQKRDQPVVILENEFLKAVVLANYGGRLYSLVDKETGREAFFCNPVIQPANLALRDAWLSGGVEWNVSQLGHTFTTCSPMYCARVTDENGEDFLRIYEYERQKRLFWQVDMHLPKGARQLYCYVRIVNQFEDTPMYWWTNTAAREDAQTRVFSATGRCLFGHSGKLWAGDMPYFPEVSDKDLSYSLNLPRAIDFFMQTPAEVKAPWEAVVYGDGAVTFERSSALLRYRKMFCWGDLPGGWRWKEFLSKEGEGSYVEIQAGIGRTQSHGLTMPADSEWDFVTAFGMTDADPIAAHGEWASAQAHIADCVDNCVSEADIYAAYEKCAAVGKKTPCELMYYGSGWGALECLRREKQGEKAIPAGYLFPADAITEEQSPWLALMQDGALPDETPSSYVIDAVWEEMLKKAPDSWQKYYHLGVIAVENLRRDEGITLFKRSAEIEETVWNLRALAELEPDGEKSLALYDKVYALGFPDVGFAQEYGKKLLAAGKRQELLTVFDSLPEAFKQNCRLRAMAVEAQLYSGDTTMCDEGFFELPFPSVREGEVKLTDLWFRYQAILLARSRGEAFSPELETWVKENLTPPRNIDFRMGTYQVATNKETHKES